MIDEWSVLVCIARRAITRELLKREEDAPCADFSTFVRVSLAMIVTLDRATVREIKNAANVTRVSVCIQVVQVA